MTLIDSAAKLGDPFNWKAKPRINRPPCDLLSSDARLGRERTMLDPAFTDNRTVRIHRWVPWIAGFSARFVDSAISRFIAERHKGAVLFDPFAGVGTALVQAKMRGLEAKGSEINPFATLASQAKLDWTVDLQLFKQTILELGGYVRRLEFARDSSTPNQPIQPLDAYTRLSDRSNETPLEPSTKPPAGFKTRTLFFDPAIEKKMLLLKEFALSVPPSLTRHFLAALGAILVKHSNYAYGPSLARKSTMKINSKPDPSVGNHYLSKITEFYQDLNWVKENVVAKMGSVPTHEIFLGNAFRYMEQLEDNSVDLVVTSPPYLNNYHYPRNTRPHLYWLDFVKTPADFGAIEWESFGKFWQTVRELPEIEVSFSLPGLQDLLERIRTKNPEKGIYGGRGWANYAAQYFNDVYRFFEALRGLMKKKGTVVWVVGNSVLRGVDVATERFTAEIASLTGFETLEVQQLRAKRIGSSIIGTHIRGQPEQPVQLHESAVILRRY